MKKLISIIAAILMTVGVFAQADKTETKELKTATKYCCSNAKCEHCSSQPGNCSHHKSAYVKEGMYYCPMHSDVTSENLGLYSRSSARMDGPI